MKIINHFINRLFIAVTCSLLFSCDFSPQVQITGELKEWHTITLTFTGPESSEYDTINPFTDYRLEVEFSNGNQQIMFPDIMLPMEMLLKHHLEKAINGGLIFVRHHDGTWNYKVSFLKGKNIAVADNLSNGEKCFMDGEEGTITVDKH